MTYLVFTVSFVLAFLLFAVQPMATKMVLPTLGGTPAVWNTAMFSFQFLLLAGYGYAHAVAAYVAPRWQWRAHALVMLCSLTLLPLAVVLPTSDAMLNQPIPYLVAAFVLQLGLPFFVLAATQPLLQAWVSRSSHRLATTPYVLYSASNLGSFAGLLGYVFLVEPMLTLREQSIGWSALYVAGAGMMVAAGWWLRNSLLLRGRVGEGPNVAMAEPGLGPLHASPRRGEGLRRCQLWIFLAFLPSSLSLGVTTYITTDIASVPLLWVMPLAIYLLSFVDAFRTRPLLVKGCQMMAPMLGLAAMILYAMQGHRFAFGFPFHLVTFAVMAFALHGWLAQLKPPAAQLTRFYLCLSIGGALGGLLNGLAAPLLLRDTLEYPLVLMVASIVTFMLMQRATGEGWVMRQIAVASQVIILVLLMTGGFYFLFSFLENKIAENFAHLEGQTLVMSACFSAILTLLAQRRFVKAFYACIAVILMMLLAISTGSKGFETRFRDRNFFGVERIYDDPSVGARFLLHDTTTHGVQSLKPGDAARPYSYYGMLAPTFETLPVMRGYPMAAVGLGIGSISCLAAEGQTVDFFEINPMVKQLAEDPRYFQQLRDCPGDHRVHLIDGRIGLSREADGKYGVIVLDAFSSDAIPAHLLTREAVAMYLRKLAPGGVLLLHTTNRHLDLWPVIGTHADGLNVPAYGQVFRAPMGQRLLYTSFWVAMANRPEDLAPLVDDEDWKPVHGKGQRPWTDQYINLFPYFKVLR